MPLALLAPTEYTVLMSVVISTTPEINDFKYGLKRWRIAEFALAVDYMGYAPMDEGDYICFAVADQTK